MEDTEPTKSSSVGIADGSFPYRSIGDAIVPDGSKPEAMGSGLITSLLSRGGSSIIYEIWNAELEVRRAVKLLDPNHFEESRDRFDTEIKISAKLHHPNIVEIYAVGKWHDLPYIEMECVDGCTLADLLKNGGALPVEVCLAVGILVSRALCYAHNQKYMIYGKEYSGIIHRDLKPANIMVARNGTVKLMDFGIAKPLAASERTSEGMVVGTMQYLSPEQLQGSNIDIRADIYSFGAVLYELLTGSRTFPEENLVRLVTQKINNQYQTLDAYRLRLPSRLKVLVHKCLLFEKQRRVQSALALMKNLESILASLSKQTPEEIMQDFTVQREQQTKNVVSRKRSLSSTTILTIVAACAGLSLASFGGWYIQTHYGELYKLFKATDRTTAQSTIRNPAASPIMQAGGTDTVVPPVTLVVAVDSNRVGTPTPEAEVKESAVRSDDQQVLEVQKPPKQKSLRTAKSGRGKRTNTQKGTGKVNNARSNVNSLEDIVLGRKSKTKATVVKDPVSSAEKKPPAAEDTVAILVNRLKKLYQEEDILNILDYELKADNVQNASILLSHLFPQQGAAKRAMMLWLRMLKRQNDTTRLSTFLLGNDVVDGEFYIDKAHYYLKRNDLGRAISYYDLSMKTSAEYANATTLNQQRVYCRAMIASAQFDLHPGTIMKKEAMDAWYEIKLLLRTSAGNPLFKQADAEIRRINAVTLEDSSIRQ